MQRKVQERPIVLPSGDHVLEGLYHRGANAPGLVVGSPHPRMGGTMHSPVVAEIAFAGARDQRPVLRFNYRGVGGSQGLSLVAEDSDPWICGGEVNDYRAALEELRETSGIRPMVAAGYSFGAAIAIQAAEREPEIAGAVLVAPPNRLFEVRGLAGLRVPTLVVAGSADPWVDLPALEASAKGAPAIRFERIADANHVFLQGLVELGSLIQGFLRSIAPTH